MPGLLWLGFILAGLLGLGRSFLGERENDCWEGLRLTPGDKSAIYLGKLAGNCVLMTAVEIILVVLFGVFYDVDLWTPAAPAGRWCWRSARSGSPRWARSSRP